MDHGVVVPGRKWTEQAIGVTHFLARRSESEPWDRLVAESRAAPGVVVLSMERLGPSADPSGRRLLDELGVTSARVVISARDLIATLVSMWQETIQNGRSWTWSDYLSDVEVRRPRQVRTSQSRKGPGATFWRQQDLPSMVHAWQRVPGVDEVSLVTVPPRWRPAQATGGAVRRRDRAATRPDRPRPTEQPRPGPAVGPGTPAGQRDSRRPRPVVPVRRPSAQAVAREDRPRGPTRPGAHSGPPSQSMGHRAPGVRRSDAPRQRSPARGVSGRDLAPGPVPGVQPEEVPEPEWVRPWSPASPRGRGYGWRASGRRGARGRRRTGQAP